MIEDEAIGEKQIHERLVQYFKAKGYYAFRNVYIPTSKIPKRIRKDQLIFSSSIEFDVLAVKKESHTIIIGVEAKTRDYPYLIAQALHRLPFVNKMYIAMPINEEALYQYGKNFNHLRQLKIGVIFFDKDRIFAPLKAPFTAAEFKEIVLANLPEDITLQKLPQN